MYSTPHAVKLIINRILQPASEVKSRMHLDRLLLYISGVVPFTLFSSGASDQACMQSDQNSLDFNLSHLKLMWRGMTRPLKQWREG